MHKFRIGDLVYIPSKHKVRFSELLNNIFVITRYVDDRLIIIGFINTSTHEIESEYIVDGNDIKKYVGTAYIGLVEDLAKKGYLIKNGEAFELDHTNDSVNGYLPIYGIDSMIAFKN